MREDEICRQAENDEIVRLNVQFSLNNLGKLFVMTIINKVASIQTFHGS